MLLIFFMALQPARAADNSEKATITLANQHMVVNVLSAMCFCKNREWPSGIAALREFHASNEISLPVDPDWQILASPLNSLVAKRKMVFTSAAGVIPEALAITSTNRKPGCKKGAMEVKAHMDIAE